MAKLGYIYRVEEDDTIDGYVSQMNDYGCVRVVMEESDDELLRPQWKQLMEIIQRGDELVLSRFSNAVRNTSDLSNLIEYCRTMRIRLISLGDEIDSEEKMYPKTTAARVLAIVGSLPEDAIAIRSQKAHVERIRKAALARKVTAIRKDNREQVIVNMYHQGHAVDDIWAASGFASKSSLYRVLNKHGVKLDRGKFSGPRKKKEISGS